MTTHALPRRCAVGATASLLIAFLFVPFISACSSGNSDSQSAADAEYTMGEPIRDSTIAAIVTSEFGSDTLTTAEFRTQFARISSQVPQISEDPDQSRELRKNIVEDFVLRHALFGEADRLGVTTDEADVSARLEQIKGQFPSEEAFQQALMTDNVSEEELVDNIQEMVRQEEMFERFAESAVEPEADDVEEFRESRAQQVRASHILFLVPEGAREERRDSIQAQAAAVLDSIKAGSNFAQMARRHSEDGTAQMGGDLGYFSRGQMVAPFEDAVFALSDSGSVTDDLVETRYGYHIIQLTGKRTGQMMDTTQARELMVRNRQREAVQEEIDDLKEKVTVRVNPSIVDADLNG